MGSGLFFTVSALFIIVFIIEFACTLASLYYNQMPFISNIILKLYLVYIITWAFIFTVYIFVISHEKDYLIKIKNRSKKVLSILYWISIIIIFILPIKLVIKNNFAILIPLTSFIG